MGEEKRTETIVSEMSNDIPGNDLKIFVNPPASTTAVPKVKQEEGAVEDVLSEEDLGNILQQSSQQGDSRVVVEVVASMCRSCKAFAPKYKRIAADYFPIRFLKVTGDENEKTKQLVKTRL